MAAARPETQAATRRARSGTKQLGLQCAGHHREKQTCNSIYSAFKTRIAEPRRWRDFWPGDGKYVTARFHHAYPFRGMTARDMARLRSLRIPPRGQWGFN